MKKTYKNKIFETLLNHPLGIDNFDVIDAGDLCIVYKPHERRFQYVFINSEASFDYFMTSAVNFAPGFSANHRASRPLPFKDVLEDFTFWLDNEITAFNNDHAEIDLWSEYQKRINQIALNEEDYFDLHDFSSREKESIKQGLNELKLIISERFTATDAQLELVNNRIDYLAAAADRTNKTDYKAILINTIISIMIALSLDAKRGQELYDLFIQVLQFMPGLGN